MINKGIYVPSWALLLLFVVAIAAFMWLGHIIECAKKNRKRGHSLPKSIFEATKGYVLAPNVRQRKVIDAKRRKDGSYRVMISDGKNAPQSVIAVTSKIARRKDRAPEMRSYVKGVYPLSDTYTGESTELYLVCVNYESIRDVEDAINRYLKREYFNKMQVVA